MSDCRTCGNRDYLCQQCKIDELESRHGTPSEHFETADDVDDDRDELEYECTSCGHEYRSDGSDACPECGARRRRYVGDLSQTQEIATDGGSVELVPAHIDYDDLIGAECPGCDEEMTPGSIRWSGRVWEHKSREAHPQAGHHRISEPLEEPLEADGGEKQ